MKEIPQGRRETKRVTDLRVILDGSEESHLGHRSADLRADQREHVPDNIRHGWLLRHGAEGKHAKFGQRDLPTAVGVQ